MKSNKQVFLSLMLCMLFACSYPALPQAAAAKPGSSPGPSPWCVQVNELDVGDVNLEPAFRIAVYENLLDELAKTKRFKQVFRSGDSHAGDASNLLILKTTVQKYTPGNETKRAVTTVTGATKLKVRSQLVTREGQTILEKDVEGDVRFFGGNLRVTHNLAHNIVEKIKESTLPEPKAAAAADKRFEPTIESLASSVAGTEFP